MTVNLIDFTVDELNTGVLDAEEIWLRAVQRAAGQADKIVYKSVFEEAAAKLPNVNEVRQAFAVFAQEQGDRAGVKIVSLVKRVGESPAQRMLGSLRNMFG